MDNKIRINDRKPQAEATPALNDPILSRFFISSEKRSTPLNEKERKGVYVLATNLVELLGFDKVENLTAYYAAKLHLDNIIHFLYAEYREYLTVPHILAIACFESDKVNAMLSLSEKTQAQAGTLQQCFGSGDLKKLIALGGDCDTLYNQLDGIGSGSRIEIKHLFGKLPALL